MKIELQPLDGDNFWSIEGEDVAVDSAELMKSLYAFIQCSSGVKFKIISDAREELSFKYLNTNIVED